MKRFDDPLTSDEIDVVRRRIDRKWKVAERLGRQDRERLRLDTRLLATIDHLIRNAYRGAY